MRKTIVLSVALAAAIIGGLVGYFFPPHSPAAKDFVHDVIPVVAAAGCMLAVYASWWHRRKSN